MATTTPQKPRRKPEQKLPPLRADDKAPTPRPRTDEEDNEPLMRISALRPKRPSVVLEFEDGSAHRVELELLSKLPIAKQQGLIHAGNEYDSLMDTDIESLPEPDRSAAETRLKELLDYQFDRVLVRPDGMAEREFKRLKASCDDFGRSQVVRAFMLAPLQIALRDQAKLNEQQRSDSNETSISETS